MQLDAHVIAMHLYQRDMLTLKQLQSVQSLRRLPVKAAEMLLNIIMIKPDAVYLCFLAVLKLTEQQHIYEALVKDGYKGKYNAVLRLVHTGDRVESRQIGDKMASNRRLSRHYSVQSCR